MYANPCCCEAPCIRCEDNFDRSDNTDVTVGQPSGCTGTEDAGSWDIEGNTLRVVANTNARIRMVTDTSAPALIIGNVQVKVHGTTSGDKARVVLLGAGDVVLMIVEMVFGGLLTIRDFGGGFYIEGGSVPVNTWFTVTIRLQAGETAGTSAMYAEIDGVGVASSMLSTTTSTPGSTFSPKAVQLGTGNVCTGTVRFNDFVAREFNTAAVGSGQCAKPLGCGWPAQLELPDTIYALVEDATQGATTSPPCDSSVCDSLNGLYTLTRVTPVTGNECARFEQSGLNFICQNCIDDSEPAATKAVVLFYYIGTGSPYAHPRWLMIFSIGDTFSECNVFLKAHNFGDLNHSVPNPLEITANDDVGADHNARCDTAPSKVTLYT